MTTRRNKLLSCLSIAVGGGLAFAGVNIHKGDERFYANYLMPAIHSLVDAERSHKIAIALARLNLVPRAPQQGDDDKHLLETTVFGIKFENPVGLAAGFDKDGEAVSGLSRMGFGFLEVGSVTPKAQPGNEKPRVFRLLAEHAIINRYGFNSGGHQVVKENLEKQLLAGQKATVIGINLGKNKSSEDAASDYSSGLVAFSKCQSVDYFVVNVSSPNTPGLRSLQTKAALESLLTSVIATKESLALTKPLLVKISPDLSPDERKDVAAVVRKKFGRGLDGIIVSNTTTSRPGSTSRVAEEGGLSGAPLHPLSTQLISDMYRLTGGKVPIVGVGGISSGQDAFEKIKAGASLLQLYSSLAFQGPPVVNAVKRDLAKLLRENGFANVKEAVGADNKT